MSVVAFTGLRLGADADGATMAPSPIRAMIAPTSSGVAFVDELLGQRPRHRRRHFDRTLSVSRD
jgi:hypothetical protein